MLEQRIQQQFFESADLKYQAAEVLCRPIEQAVAALVAGLTAGGRVLVAGLGASASLAQLVTAELVGCFERERPGLAALALASLALDPLNLFVGCLFSIVALLAMLRLFKRRLQGFTGDCLGTTQQVCEIAFYLGLAVSLQ